MAVREQIPITRLALDEAEVESVTAVVQSGWLAQGRQVAAFERAVAEAVGTGHAVAVSSGTAALHLALVALGVGPGDEVLVPSLSFIATANAVRYVGARPVFVEVDRRTFNLDPARLEEQITPRARAILPVHQLGLCADMDPLREVAARRGLAVVEDAACALGATYRGRAAGALGSRAACFSFHPRKVITTGEGGMVTTDDGALADRLRMLRAQGASVAADARDAAELVFEEYPVVGYNYRLTDIQAAIGLAQLKKLPALLARRRSLAARYAEKLAGVAGVRAPIEPAGFGHAWQSYMVLLEGTWSRREVMQKLLQRGVASRRAVTAIHETAAYRDVCGGVRLPITEKIARRGLMLPLFPQLTEEEQDRVVAALADACR